MVLEIHYSLKYLKSNLTLSKSAFGIALRIISHCSSTAKRSGVIIWKGEQSIAAPVPPFPVLLSGLDLSSHLNQVLLLPNPVIPDAILVETSTAPRAI